VRCSRRIAFIFKIRNCVKACGLLRIKKPQCSRIFQQCLSGHWYYMLQTPFDSILKKRNAIIETLDSFLLHHHSEYDYLYKILRGYSQIESASLEDFYGVPNLARKLLETFMSFRQPGNMELMARLEREKYDPVIISRIFSFVNFHSHGGLDRGEGVDLSLLSETPQAITQIFEFMKVADPKHVERMDELIAI